MNTEEEEVFHSSMLQVMERIVVVICSSTVRTSSICFDIKMA